MNKKVAVILSGCGVYDGSEIYESVITLLGNIMYFSFRLMICAPYSMFMAKTIHLSQLQLTGNRVRQILTAWLHLG